jgi:8-oxo-dGTP pyrophosphatase MutT (NUDIX family)
VGGVVARDEGFFSELSGLLRARKRLELPGEGIKPAAVLIPLFFGPVGPSVVFMRRPEGTGVHSGQVAFPGGSVDSGDASTLATALREAEEELGIAPSAVEALGCLDDHIVISGFRMTPWVGRIPAGLVYRPNAAEVARVFDVPLDSLVDPEKTRFRFETMNRRGFPVDVPFFETAGEVIWGATGRILLQLLGITHGFAPPEPGDSA